MALEKILNTIENSQPHLNFLTYLNCLVNVNMSRIAHTELLPVEPKKSRGPQRPRKPQRIPKPRPSKNRGLRYKTMKKKLETMKNNNAFFQWLKSLQVPQERKDRAQSAVLRAPRGLKFTKFQIVMIMFILLPQQVIGLDDTARFSQLAVAAGQSDAALVPDAGGISAAAGDDNAVGAANSPSASSQSIDVSRTLSNLVRKQGFDTSLNKTLIQKRDQNIFKVTSGAMKNVTKRFTDIITSGQGPQETIRRKQIMYPVFRKFMVDYISNIVYKNDQTFVTSLEAKTQGDRFRNLTTDTRGIIKNAFDTMGFPTNISRGLTDDVYQGVSKNFENDQAVIDWANHEYNPSEVIQNLQINTRVLVTEHMQNNWNANTLYDTIILDTALSNTDLSRNRNMSKALENATITPENAAGQAIITTFKARCDEYHDNFNVPSNLRRECLGFTLVDEGKSIIKDVLSVSKVVNPAFAKGFDVDAEHLAQNLAFRQEVFTKHKDDNGDNVNVNIEFLAKAFAVVVALISAVGIIPKLCFRPSCGAQRQRTSPPRSQTSPPRTRTTPRTRITPITRHVLGPNAQVFNKKVFILRGARDTKPVGAGKYWIKDGNEYRRIGLKFGKWVTLKTKLQTQNIDKKTKQLIGTIDDNGILQES